MRPPKLYPLVDFEPIVAVVRCRDDATYDQLARQWWADRTRSWPECPYELVLDRPVFRWFRIDPCGQWCGEHAWHLAEMDGPGHSRWVGAYVRWRIKPEEARDEAVAAVVAA